MCDEANICLSHYSKLVNSQVSMSDAERDRILKEHEKQMVKLENRYTSLCRTVENCYDIL